MKNLKFRNAKLSEYNDLKIFFESFYGENYYEVEYKYFRWLQYENPLRHLEASEDEFTSFVAVDSDEIVGSINYVPMEFYINGIPYQSTWSVGWLVKNGYSAISGMLLKKNFLRFNYYMSMGATQWVKSIYTKQLGFEYQHNIPRTVMVGKAGELIDLIKRNPDLKTSDFSKIYDWQGDTLKIAEKSNYYCVTAIDDLNDKYWENHLRRHKVTINRDRKYMKWRYFDHPHIQYDVISGDKSQDSGIAVLRIETAKDSDVKVARLTDFFPIDGNEEVLTGAVARYLIDKGAVFLDFFCGSSNFINNYMDVPFIHESEHMIFSFPRLLHPIEWRERYSINASLGRNARKSDSLPQIQISDIYFTKGDPSQDIVLNREYFTRGV
ncbi:MAG: hypothetical protein HQK91_03040 [Nitrospirae bacterium]|nr:hypothetical protein [Nitrospirota bacterium]